MRPSPPALALLVAASLACAPPLLESPARSADRQPPSVAEALAAGRAPAPEDPGAERWAEGFEDPMERGLAHELLGDVADAVDVYLAVIDADPRATEALRRLSPTRLWLAADGTGDVASLDQALAEAPAMATLELAPGRYAVGAPITRPVRLLASGGPAGRVELGDVVLHGAGDEPLVVAAPFCVLDGLRVEAPSEGPALLVDDARVDLLDVRVTGDVQVRRSQVVVEGGRVEAGGVRVGGASDLSASFWRLVGAPGPALTLGEGSQALLVRPAVGGCTTGLVVDAEGQLLVDGGSLVGVGEDGVRVAAGGFAELLDVRIQDGPGAGVRLLSGAGAVLQRCRVRGFGQPLVVEEGASLEQLDNVLRFR